VTERHQPVRIALEACQPERNHHRAYEVEAGQYLLFEWVVTVRYGRAAQPGHRLTYWMPDLGAARTLLRGRLCRRLSAPERLGCGYRLTHAALAKGEQLADRMPDGLLS
jgi:hypothetical protein